MTTAAAVFGLGALVVIVIVGVRRFRRRSVFLPMLMSDGWRRDHAADPLADHLR